MSGKIIERQLLRSTNADGLTNNFESTHYKHILIFK